MIMSESFILRERVNADVDSLLILLIPLIPLIEWLVLRDDLSDDDDDSPTLMTSLLENKSLKRVKLENRKVITNGNEE